MGRGFTEKSEGRISSAVQYVERASRSRRPERRRWFGKNEDLKPFEMIGMIGVGEGLTDWIPPKTPYDDNYTMSAEDLETGDTRTIWFPTFWDYDEEDWRTLSLFFGVGRKAWLQENGGMGGATVVWCTHRSDHWEIVSGLFATHAWGKADGVIASMGTGTMDIWWSSTSGTPGSWTMTASGYAVDVFNWGAEIADGAKGLAMYHPAENHWTVQGF